MSEKTTGSGRRWSMLAWLCLAVVLSLSSWFSATAVAPGMIAALALPPSAAAWLTNAVQLGFVTGALLSSLVNLPDILRMNRLAAAAALAAGLTNAGLLLEPGLFGAVTARFLCGMALAGVYPPAMKLAATWFQKGRGLALGFVIGALTAGSSLPHLFAGLSSSLDWRLVVGLASLCAVFGALLFLLVVKEGPFPFSKATFDPRQIAMVLRNRSLMLVNAGYLGHMWELYALWAWLLAFLSASPAAFAGNAAGSGSLATFAALTAGVLGCLIGGVLSDRIGRAATTAGMMIASGSCALLVGFVFDGPPLLLMLVVCLWGITVIGDSAQFSAAATELCDQHLVGTALSLQMGLGFALTIVSIWLMPQLADVLGGWQWCFLFLAPGPFLGAWAMLHLRRTGRLA
ncbi:nitrate/nitrite transporter [Rhizobium sp. SSA_523]|uniref:MFS transporter n=1 Tax=Rhizobium sp. SSA_523 TaxID=2952477 RepID=UPI002091AD87|nr:MFS transporter [Rhizobium sp. SSA_523]MCO5731699.1 MFS transporter [Rhizobium sp. SSA_523]WKC22925.1 MFS transporter [Rhizobium sp. SSA_523]